MERLRTRRHAQSDSRADFSGDQLDVHPWGPIVVGEPIFDFEPKPPQDGPYRPDTIYDNWSSGHVAVRLASIRGYSHRYHGIPRQDQAEIAFHPGSGAVIFAVADGVSNARRPHIGATIACQTAVGATRRQLSSGAETIDWAAVLADTVRALTARASHTLRQEAPTQAAVLDLFATTLVAGVAGPAETGVVASMVQIGDTSAWLLRQDRYECVLKNKHDPREQVIPANVVALPWLPDRITPVTVTVPADAVLLIGTDGFGDPLGDGDGQVGKLFARCLRTPPPGPSLAHMLDFSRETFDDDRTLVAMWPLRRAVRGVWR